MKNFYLVIDTNIYKGKNNDDIELLISKLKELNSTPVASPIVFLELIKYLVQNQNDKDRNTAYSALKKQHRLCTLNDTISMEWLAHPEVYLEKFFDSSISDEKNQKFTDSFRSISTSIFKSSSIQDLDDKTQKNIEKLSAYENQFKSKAIKDIRNIQINKIHTSSQELCKAFCRSYSRNDNDLDKIDQFCYQNRFFFELWSQEISNLPKGKKPEKIVNTINDCYLTFFVGSSRAGKELYLLSNEKMFKKCAKNIGLDQFILRLSDLQIKDC